MGYQVYWSNGRWQGYAIPSYCDHPECKEKIDRGMGYMHPEDNDIFCCSKHQYEKIDYTVDYEKEHPEWLLHILRDPSWGLWRTENTEIVNIYTKLLSAMEKKDKYLKDLFKQKESDK